MSGAAARRHVGLMARYLLHRRREPDGSGVARMSSAVSIDSAPPATHRDPAIE